MSKTQETISALKASVGSYFWEETGAYDTDGISKGYVIAGGLCFRCCNGGFTLGENTTVLTLEEAKTILKVYATAWERAHPEGAFHEPITIRYNMKRSVLSYAGQTTTLYHYLQPSPEAIVEGEKSMRQSLHDRLKKQLNP